MLLNITWLNRNKLSVLPHRVFTRVAHSHNIHQQISSTQLRQILSYYTTTVFRTKHAVNSSIWSKSTRTAHFKFSMKFRVISPHWKCYVTPHKFALSPCLYKSSNLFWSFSSDIFLFLTSTYFSACWKLASAYEASVTLLCFPTVTP